MENNTNNYILLTMMLIFVLLGFVMPFISSEFGHDAPSSGVDEIQQNAQNTQESELSILSLLWSIVSMFFWSFGTMPTVVNLILLPFRLLFWIIAYDKIRGI